MPKFHIEYSANNSGGGWWLSDNDWLNLEKDGWKICWVKNDTNPLFKDSIKATGRWLGAIAKYACKDFEAEKPEWARMQAEEDFSGITGQDPFAEGCTTCGPPHNFYPTEVENCVHTLYTHDT